MHTESKILPLRTRLAPTPSGFLHLGNAFSFAVTWALARKAKGKIILRIDDLDNLRARREYIEDIFETLHFLGITWDEGPENTDDFRYNYSQHKRLQYYKAALAELEQKQLLYACHCSRSNIAAISATGNYNYNCRNSGLALNTPKTALRIRTNHGEAIRFEDMLCGKVEMALDQVMPDFIVRRKDGIPAYQVASLVDDVQMNINCIVRGEDLLPSTAAQLYLAGMLGQSAFTKANFMHHTIIRGALGEKLSKSHNSLSIKQMRKSGACASHIWLKLSEMAGQQPADSAQAFMRNFCMPNLPTAIPASETLHITCN